MKMKHLIGCMLVLVGLFCLQSCDRDIWGNDPYRIDYFFGKFFKPTEMRYIYTLEGGGAAFDISGPYFNAAENSAISQSLGDGEFKGVIWDKGATIYYPIKKMKVFTICDYNECYKAGCDISNLVDCYISSYYEFVQASYSLDYPQESPEINALWGYYLDSYQLGRKLYKMPVSDIDSINSRLIDPKFILAFREAPDSLGDHDFQLEINIADTLIRTNFTHSF